MMLLKSLRDEEIGIRNRLTDQRVEDVLLESCVQHQIDLDAVDNLLLGLLCPRARAFEAREELLDAPVVVLQEGDGIHCNSSTPARQGVRLVEANPRCDSANRDELPLFYGARRVAAPSIEEAARHHGGVVATFPGATELVDLAARDAVPVEAPSSRRRADG